jgi:hypothetical protein
MSKAVRTRKTKTVRLKLPKPKQRKCSICRKVLDPFVWDHNAQPINNGRCCGECNSMYVIPARIAQLPLIKAITREKDND